jgi:hypothetical protein
MADITAIERKLEIRLGRLIARLANLDAQVENYKQQLQRLRNQGILGSHYLPVEEQFRRAWEVPVENAGDSPPQSLDERQIKRLYRKLARRFHPDLAHDSEEIGYRTEKMTALNDAYKARSLVELAALASEGQELAANIDASNKTESQMVQALENELKRIKRRLRQIENDLKNAHNNKIVQLSVKVKFAQRDGRDLLSELATDLKKKIRRRRAERDMLKAELDQMQKGSGIDNY